MSFSARRRHLSLRLYSGRKSSEEPETQAEILRLTQKEKRSCFRSVTCGFEREIKYIRQGRKRERERERKTN